MYWEPEEDYDNSYEAMMERSGAALIREEKPTWTGPNYHSVRYYH